MFRMCFEPSKCEMLLQNWVGWKLNHVHVDNSGVRRKSLSPKVPYLEEALNVNGPSSDMFGACFQSEFPFNLVLRGS